MNFDRDDSSIDRKSFFLEFYRRSCESFSKLQCKVNGSKVSSQNLLLIRSKLVEMFN